jgi:glycosyltransferase involved in cell wall biosynthesis
LKSLSFCDEIIVVDDQSIDQTQEFAEKKDARIFVHPLADNWAQQRNFGLKKAKGDWVLFIDADERVTEALASEISNFKFQISNEVCGFYLKRQDYMWGKALKHGETASVRFLRLAKKGSGVWRRKVHEVWDINGETHELANPIYHYSHPTLRAFLAKINKFSTLHAIANKEEGKNSSILKIVIWPIGHFVYNFIFRLGFLDGIPGFAVAVVMSFNSFLAWSKLWFYQKGLQERI